MISIRLDAVAIGFEDHPVEGVKVMVFSDERSGIQVSVPLAPETAHELAALLDGRPAIHIVKQLPEK